MTNGRGYLSDANMPALPGGREYQLWAYTNTSTTPVSLGVIGSTIGSTGFSGGSGLRLLAITDEAPGGAVQPTGQPLVSAAVTT